jgi:CheY-like chemotaxis protein
MMMIKKKRLLWVDDDGEKRFRYERRILQKEGWEVVWAVDIDTACSLLTTEEFGALILDQSLPFVKDVTPTGIEGGYLLLHWLRRGALPEQFDLPQGDTTSKPSPPRPSNRLLPVLFVSAYFDEDLRLQMQKLNGESRPIEIAPKPLDQHELLRFIEIVPEI